ncbi:MAG: nuclear transport factor 2 family protein [Anaerolineae bacterium]|nr:nuclear transport factor 2 family protein [Anaerolineae bacterium]
MNNKRNILLAATILLLASLACQSLAPSEEPASLPPEIAVTEEESSPVLPSDSTDTEEESAQTGGVYDGDWVGTNTVDDKEILFVVENNEITSVSLNYTGESNGCDYHGAISAGSPTGSLSDASISNDAFAVSYEGANDVLTFTGAFTSESEASGTLHIKSPAEGLCGVYEKEISWVATKGSAAEAEPEEDTSGTVSDEDTNAIITQFFDAINAGDIDSAVAMTGENVMFSFGATNAQLGRDNLKAYLTSSGLTYQVSDVDSFGGGMAQFTATASDGTSYSFCTILLQDGEIISITLQP